jgi:F-type H+-transporting ATPase subunit b
MRPRPALLLLMVVVAMTVLAPEPALAAGGPLSPLQWTAKILNFLIFVTLIVLGARAAKAILMLDEKRDEVQRELAEAEEKHREADARLAEARTALERVKQEAGELRRKAEEQGAEEAERLMERARAEVERVLSLGERQVEAEVRDARLRLRGHAAALATKIAENIVREEMAPEDRERLFEEYLSLLESEA